MLSLGSTLSKTTAVRATSEALGETKGVTGDSGFVPVITVISGHEILNYLSILTRPESQSFLAYSLSKIRLQFSSHLSLKIFCGL